MRHHSAVRVQILDDVDIPLWGILIDFPKEPDFQLDSSDIQALRIPADPCGLLVDDWRCVYLVYLLKGFVVLCACACDHIIPSMHPKLKPKGDVNDL